MGEAPIACRLAQTVPTPAIEFLARGSRSIILLLKSGANTPKLETSGYEFSNKDSMPLFGAREVLRTG
eukprot:8149833-Prorocentrum_lima.AAC.1